MVANSIKIYFNIKPLNKYFKIIYRHIKNVLLSLTVICFLKQTERKCTVKENKKKILWIPNVRRHFKHSMITAYVTSTSLLLAIRNDCGHQSCNKIRFRSVLSTFGSAVNWKHYDNLECSKSKKWGCWVIKIHLNNTISFQILNYNKILLVLRKK